MAKNKSGIIKNTLVLVIVTFVAILALAVVNQVTMEPIAQAEIDARNEVYKAVYADANSFTEVENTQKLLEESPALLAEKGFDGCSINDVLAVTDATGTVEGYVIAATSPSGYGGDVQIAIGIKDGVITGFDVVSNSETAGLGSRCTDDEFTSQFDGKPVTQLEYTKTGATEPNQIDAISGATITTNAVTQAVNSAIVFYQENFGATTDTLVGVVEEVSVIIPSVQEGE
ncbi:MAG: RnfABCDGE type electron transport complex subunit G [Eubacterium sp.]|nr:RnfABCDGE type electron transport complex subunit G [Eubacterium sp.]